jgi:gag-polypeptide of LTR copia-type
MNYQPWTTRMLNAFRAADLEEMILRTESDDKTKNWQIKNSTAMSFITSCIVNSLLPKIQSCKTAAECWKVFENQYKQVGMGSVIIWTRAMIKLYQNGNDIAKHINDFKAARRNLVKAEFDIPDHIAVAMLVSTLPSDPGDPFSWNGYISSLKLTKTATFDTTVNGILEESKRRNIHAPTSAAPNENAYAAIESTARANSVLFCKNCKCLGHNNKNCYSKGGGSEKKYKRPSKGKRANEKANAVETQDDVGESSHFVVEQCFSITDFSAYTRRD